MTAPSMYASITQIRRDAAQLDPVKTFLTLLGLVPMVLFFVARFAWMLPAFLWASGMWGWRRADAIVKAREASARGG